MSIRSIRAEILRKRYKYRDLILKGKIRVPLSVAKKLIGPDTAYHLYSQLKRGKDNPDGGDRDKNGEE